MRPRLFVIAKESAMFATVLIVAPIGLSVRIATVILSMGPTGLTVELDTGEPTRTVVGGGDAK
jgi:hypothetical protein